MRASRGCPASRRGAAAGSPRPPRPTRERSPSAPARLRSGAPRAPPWRSPGGRGGRAPRPGPPSASSIRASCSSMISSKRSAGGFAWPADPSAHPLELQEVLHAAHRVAERPVGRIHGRGGLEADRLLLRGPQPEVVRVQAPVQPVKAPLEVGPIQAEPALEPEHRPVIAPLRERPDPAARWADRPLDRGRAAARAGGSSSLIHFCRQPVPQTPTGPRRRPGQNHCPLRLESGRDAACPAPA